MGWESLRGGGAADLMMLYRSAGRLQQCHIGNNGAMSLAQALKGLKGNKHLTTLVYGYYMSCLAVCREMNRRRLTCSCGRKRLSGNTIGSGGAHALVHAFQQSDTWTTLECGAAARMRGPSREIHSRRTWLLACPRMPGSATLEP